MIGQTVSHYRILSKLGEGGMGVVYKAEDTKLKRTVALKFLPPGLTRNKVAKNRFMREAQAASALQHNNICAIHEIDETQDGRLFICMDCYDGETLKEKIDRGPLPLREALAIAIQVAEGLSKAHEARMVHRDIKPANIMVTKDDVVKVLDFGLAKLAGKTRVTRTGTTVGTVGYMSPEQARGEQVDHRTDIWSLGAVLYEMITGGLPFAGDYEQAVVYRILNEEPKPITSLRSNMPIELERIVATAMQKDRTHRYERVDDMLADLRFLAGDSVSEELKGRPTISIDKYRIAVLPFTNISPDPQDEYFADGMTEELISTLSRIRDFRIIARTSVMQYKGASKTVSDIGRELKVGAVVEGSVRKSVNKLRITAQLVDVKTQEHVWTQNYDRELEDVFDIQRDVAQQVAAALKVELMVGEQRAVNRKPAGNLEAYSLYLKGRYFWNKFSEEGLQTSIEYFGRAIEKDGNYALAYVGLAAAYSVLGVNYMPPLEVIPKAKAALESALAIDPGLPEAHVVRGAIKLFFDWDWVTAERELKSAIEINSNDATAHQLYAYCLEVTGRPDDALAEIRLAQELDPLSLVINCDVGIRYYFSRQYDRAIDQYLKTLEMDPNLFIAHIWLERAYEQKGMYEEAVSEYQERLTILSGNTERATALGHAFKTSGFKGVLQTELDELEQLSKARYVSPLDIATIYTRLDQRDRAFEWLDKAHEERCGLLPLLDLDPSFDSLRSDPRFDALRKKVGLAR